MPPNPGIMPNCTSGSPSCVFSLSETAMKSQAKASSNPPPKATPSIAAIVRHGKCANFDNIDLNA